MFRRNRKRAPGGWGASALRRRRRLGEGFISGRHLLLECLEPRRLLSLSPIISEVDPGNKSGITDLLGNAADWLEIYNPDPTAADNLTGWSINYAKTGGSGSSSWTFPTNTILGPGEFRVIFGDSNYTSTELSEETALGELDTGFNLSKAGATLELLNSSDAVVSSLTYPSLSSDTSYGPAETVNETDLVAAGATASYYTPTNNSLGTTWTGTSFNASSWSSGATGLGYTGVPGFATTLYRANVSGTIGSVETAQTVINTPAEQSSATSATESTLDFMDTGGGGHFTSVEKAFPGMTIGEGLSNIVLQATGTLTITSAQAGYYTFGVNSDDGFKLTLTGASFSNGAGDTTCSGTVLEYDGGRGAADTLGTTYLAPGSYPINLVYFQGNGGDSMEFYAAKESSSSGVTSFDANSILVGNTTATTASGGTSTTTTPLLVTSTPFAGSNVSPLAASIQTNVYSTVQAAIATAGSTSLYSRITFNDSASLTSLTLRMQYASGYVAYLNGVKIASSNAPTSPTWNSTASSYLGSPVQASTYEDIDLSSYLNSGTTGHLTATNNVLAIQTLMAPSAAISSITYSGTTATVTTTSASGYFTGDEVQIAGATPAVYDGLFAITVTGTDTFTYTLPSTPTTNASGASMTATPASQSLLVLPELCQMTSVIAGDHVYSTPTPGAPNVLSNVQPDIAFSTTHGLFYSPFEVTLTPDITGESIYYTTDNSVPLVAPITEATASGTTVTITSSAADNNDLAAGQTVTISGFTGTSAGYNGSFAITAVTATTFTYTDSNSNLTTVTNSGTVTNGTLYTGPLSMITTTVLQAVMVDATGNNGPYQTETYVFPDAVASQPAAPAGFPTVWDGVLEGTSVPADYAMNAGSSYGFTTQQAANALASLPSISIVTSNANMFGPDGIYSNSGNRTFSYPGSFEYFDPNNPSLSYSGLVSIQMNGGVGRTPQYLVHTFQVNWGASSGLGYLNANIFGDGYLPDGVILRNAFNDGWQWGGPYAQYIIDQWTRNALTAEGARIRPAFGASFTSTGCTGE